MKSRYLFASLRSLSLLAVSLYCLAGIAAAAEAPPTMTFGASVTSANGSLSTRLTWSTTPGATGCTASGHSAWTGAKPGAGTLDLPAITMSGTYSLSLACSWTPNQVAAIGWTTPIQNTDGSAMAKCSSQTATGPCLRSYKIYHGVTATELTDVRAIDDRDATTYSWSGLTANTTHYFAMTALNGNGVESSLSAVGSKVVGAATTQTMPLTLTVNPVPNGVGGFTVN